MTATPQMLVLLAALVAALVRLLKDDRAVAWFPVTVPPRWRPVAALALGLVAAALTAKAKGTSWTAALTVALTQGLGAGGLAVAAHDALIEGVRGGRELGESPEAFETRTSTRPPPMPPPEEPPADQWPGAPGS